MRNELLHLGSDRKALAELLVLCATARHAAILRRDNGDII
jgi:hypothetical protein